MLHQPLGVDVGIVDESAYRVTAFAEIVRGHVGGHSDGDAGRTVEQQKRHLGREHGGLLEGVVEIQGHVDRVLVDVGENLGRDLLELGFGVSHRGYRVTVHGAEITLTVYEGIPLIPVLRQTRHGVVDARIAVGVKLTEHLADDTGGFLGLSAVAQIEPVHTEQNPALHGLEAVTRIGEGARDNHRHRIVDVGRAHLLVDLDRLDYSHRFFLNLFRILYLTIHKILIPH